MRSDHDEFPPVDYEVSPEEVGRRRGITVGGVALIIVVVAVPIGGLLAGGGLSSGSIGFFLIGLLVGGALLCIGALIGFIGLIYSFEDSRNLVPSLLALAIVGIIVVVALGPLKELLQGLGGIGYVG